MMRTGSDGTSGCQRAGDETRRGCDDFVNEVEKMCAPAEATIAEDPKPGSRAWTRRPPSRPDNRPPERSVTRPRAAASPPTRIRMTPRDAAPEIQTPRIAE